MYLEQHKQTLLQVPHPVSCSLHPFFVDVHRDLTPRFKEYPCLQTKRTVKPTPDTVQKHRDHHWSSCSSAHHPLHNLDRVNLLVTHGFGISKDMYTVDMARRIVAQMCPLQGIALGPESTRWPPWCSSLVLLPAPPLPTTHEFSTHAAECLFPCPSFSSHLSSVVFCHQIHLHGAPRLTPRSSVGDFRRGVGA